jgi:hypothetical protein
MVGALGLAALGGGAWFFLFRNKGPQVEPNYYYRCEGCKRKLKYTAKQVKRKGMCPMCKRTFIFPPPPQPQPQKK